MKRWLVSYFDGKQINLKLYYPTLDDVKATYPNAIISELDDVEHIPFINAIIDRSIKQSEYSKNGYEIREVYSYTSDIGSFTIILSKDLRDNHYYDYVEYLHYKKYSLTIPVLRTITTPQEFYEKFIVYSGFEYEIVSITKHPGNGEKLPKPAELKGVNQIGSAKFSKASNGVFICGKDLYIRCNDYFSPTMKAAPEDIGTPLSYRANKYIGGKKVHNKFIYADYWGDIVLKQKAWLKFSGFINLLQYYNDVQVANMCCDKIQQYHHWNDRLEVEWQIMFENICKLVRNYKNGD